MDKASKPDIVAAFLRRILHRDILSDEEKEALRDAADGTHTYRAGEDLVSEGDRLDYSTLLVTGFTTRYRMLAGGNRQIAAVHVPGDFIDLHSFVIKKMDHSVGALSDCTVIRFPHLALRRITEQFPHLTRVLWLLTMLDAAIYRQWLVVMGGQPAARQLAHFLCEICVRLQVAGLADGGQFRLPMTQADLGDTLGLSPVHVNRVLQELRGSELVSWHGQVVRILDWTKLQAFAEFDPDYLHLMIEPR